MRLKKVIYNTYKIVFKYYQYIIKVFYIIKIEIGTNIRILYKTMYIFEYTIYFMYVGIYSEKGRH